jgi:hypothetical protein
VAREGDLARRRAVEGPGRLALSERPGIVDLRDLWRRYEWFPRSIYAFVTAASLEVEPARAWHSFAPPRVMVLVVRYEDAHLLALSRPWLRASERLVIVRDRRDDTVSDDPELDALAEADWDDPRATLPIADVFDWRAGDDTACAAAIARAVTLAEKLPPRALAPAPVSPDLELPMSPWVPYSGESFSRYRRTLAATLAIREGRAVIVDERGVAIDLATLRAPVEIARVEMQGRPLATGTTQQRHPGSFTAGLDPCHPIAWRGARMGLYWSYVTPAEVGFLSATDHDWPSGPAKKLYGYSDNDTVSVALAPDAAACVMTFEHDVTIFHNPPIGWHGAGAVDVATFPRDPRRAAFYARRSDETRSEDLAHEEDNRDCPPAFVLGPSEAVQYAVGLEHRVVRVTGPHDAATGEVIGGPDAGYAVYDANHVLVRRGTGRLLGGWFRHATLEDAGALWREDLATGERTHLGSSRRVLCDDRDAEVVVLDALREGRMLDGLPVREVPGDIAVLPIPGTRNVLEVTQDHLRVI